MSPLAASSLAATDVQLWLRHAVSIPTGPHTGVHYRIAMWYALREKIVNYLADHQWTTMAALRRLSGRRFHGSSPGLSVDRLRIDDDTLLWWCAFRVDVPWLRRLSASLSPSDVIIVDVRTQDGKHQDLTIDQLEQLHNTRSLPIDELEIYINRRARCENAKSWEHTQDGVIGFNAPQGVIWLIAHSERTHRASLTALYSHMEDAVAAYDRVRIGVLRSAVTVAVIGLMLFGTYLWHGFPLYSVRLDTGCVLLLCLMFGLMVGLVRLFPLGEFAIGDGVARSARLASIREKLAWIGVAGMVIGIIAGVVGNLVSAMLLELVR